MSMELPSESPTPTDSTVASVQPPSSLPVAPSSVKAGNHSGFQNPSGLSKNKQRKLRRYEKTLEHRKERRVKERGIRKQRGSRKRRGNDEKLAEINKLKTALEVGSKIVIDCQYQSCMTAKELTRFAQQLSRVYSSNRAAQSPLHIYLTSLSKESPFYKTCCKQNEGFANYVLDIQDKPVVDLFQPDEIVYLTPDAPTTLSLEKGFEKDKVYVIGGIVDETTTKNLSHTFAETTQLASARLPIDEFFEPGGTGTYKKVLTINQVVDIILEWHRTQNWVSAISRGLPERTGLRPKLTSSVSQQ